MVLMIKRRAKARMAKKMLRLQVIRRLNKCCSNSRGMRRQPRRRLVGKTTYSAEKIVKILRVINRQLST